MPFVRTPSPALAALTALALFGCNTPKGGSFELVNPGMTEGEVRELLGAPSSTRMVPAEQREFVDYAVRWHYGDTLSSLATAAVFTDAPDPRVYVVFFDESGRVVRTRPPEEWTPPEPVGSERDGGRWSL
ncbi:MAG TPA: outer membrane protein assembly factor BamE [Phycisphaerales bacterium]|nr:outer membrane protein assembly factor BamE [Phycisphaerales bacterium]HMP37190.1 outer membrane protein assembly factor BamE [Phycisphaerales bacterium]